MKIIRWFLSLIWILLRFLIGLAILIALMQLLCTPVYDFPKKQIFSGTKFYNPYQSCDTAWWRKSVFHKHTKSWGGITHGNSSAKQTFARYNYLGYDIVALSDYQKLNPAKFDKQYEYIPNYEHGFGMKKNHHLSIGARTVLPFDFIFPQTTSNKQFIINLLRSRTEVLALAHPDWNGAVTDYDVKRLCDYDCFEIFSNYHNSINIWDSALSAGMPAFLLADDDNDEIDNPNVVGRCLTLVNAEKTSFAEVTDALKRGRTIGVRVFSIENESWEAKKKNVDDIPLLKRFLLSGDTIQISLSDTAKTISFIGQNGIIQKVDSNSLQAFYILKNKDTYLRTHIVFNNGTEFFLNPVIRFDGNNFRIYHAAVNIWVTILKNLLFLGILVLLVYFFLRGKKRKKEKYLGSDFQ
jgi:hypothetical protein